MTIWVLMKVAPLSDNLRLTLRSKHKEAAGLNELAVTFNADHSEAIVKIAGAERSFIDALGLDRADVIRIYTEADHHEIFDAIGFYTPAWQVPDDAERRVDATREIMPLMASAEPKPSLWRRMLKTVGWA